MPFGEGSLEAVGFEEGVLELVAGADQEGGVELVARLVSGAGLEGAGARRGQRGRRRGAEAG